MNKNTERKKSKNDDRIKTDKIDKYPNINTKIGSKYYIYNKKYQDKNGNWHTFTRTTDVLIYEGNRVKEEDKALTDAKRFGDELFNEFLASNQLKADNDIDYGNMPLKEYGEYCLSKLKMRFGTRKCYEGILKKHIYPQLGNIKMRDLTKDDLERYIEQKKHENELKQDALDKKIAKAIANNEPIKISSSEKPCYRSILKHRDVIRRILSYAVSKHHLDTNVAKDIDKDILALAKTDNFALQPYNRKELNAFLSAVQQSETKIKTPILIATYLGTRREEALGMKFSDFDFENDTVRIRDVVVKTDGHSVIFRRSTKTKLSSQVMPLPQKLKEHILQVKAEQERNRELLGDDYDNHTIMFEDEKGNITKIPYYSKDKELDFVCRDEFGEVLKPNYVSQTFHKLLIDNNLRVIRFHDLRHTFATLLLEKTGDIDLVRRMLRESNLDTVQIYTQLVSDEYMKRGTDIVASLIDFSSEAEDIKSSDGG